MPKRQSRTTLFFPSTSTSTFPPIACCAGSIDSSISAGARVSEAYDEADSEVNAPKNLSLINPAAPWTTAPGGPAFYAYSTNYLIDTHAGIVVDVEATPAYRSEEVNATKTMIERVETRFGMRPQHLIGDTAYGTAEPLGWMVEETGIAPHDGGQLPRYTSLAAHRTFDPEGAIALRQPC